MVITQALVLLSKVALIEENAQLIVAKGGLDCLMKIINFKCKKKELSPEKVALVTNSVRAMDRLLRDPMVARQFAHKGSLNLLKDTMEYYEHEETIRNAAMLQTLSNTGLLQGNQQGLLESYEDPATVSICADGHHEAAGGGDPKLVQGLASQNARGFIQAIRVAKILGAVHAIGVADPAALAYLKQVELDNAQYKGAVGAGGPRGAPGPFCDGVAVSVNHARDGAQGTAEGRGSPAHGRGVRQDGELAHGRPAQRAADCAGADGCGEQEMQHISVE